jgi:hydrogenase-1 operon protein HyaF
MMNPLQIPIEINHSSSGMARALFNELAEHLQRLVDHGNEHTVDLFSLPISEQDKKELEKLLGRGEVEITLTTVGKSLIFETSYNGIWWVRHYAADELLISDFIEVSWIPEIIKSHPSDVALSADRMKKIIHQDEGGEYL